MRSLFLKFFVSFWVVMGLMLGAAAIGGFLYAEQLQKTIEDFEVGDSLRAASLALADGGREGLMTWRDGTPRDDGVVIFIADESGEDISGRHIPYTAQRMLERHRLRLERIQASGPLDSLELNASRFMPQLNGPDGATYTLLVAPVAAPEAFWSNQDIRVLLLVFGTLTTGLVSYFLASALSRPVHGLRDATVALANGDLGARVAPAITERHDEFGSLGRDFDSMAAKLQRASRRQTELSRNISHELRSPLARMRIAVELARRKAGDLSEFERLEVEAERLDALIGQILSYNKLEADAKAGSQSVELLDIVSEVAENANFESGADRVRIESDIRGEAVVKGVRSALLGAIENIVRNALKHSPSEGEVRIHAGHAADAFTIEVSDEGPGVDENELDSLFDPFFRTTASSNGDGHSGTGLGLAIARRAIVDLHGGTLEAHNSGDRGLSVRMSLPAAS